MSIFLYDVVKSMVRRIRQIRLPVAVVFVSIAFICGMNIFQTNSENYMFQRNRFVYGDWAIAEVFVPTWDEELVSGGQRLGEHRYFDIYGTAISGIPITGQDGNSSKGTIGYLDECAIEVGKIKLNEGRMPEADNEIVMNMSSLAELGYTLELNQDISLKVPDSSGRLVDKTYKLVGVLNNSLGMWSVGGYMPSALVTSSELNTFNYYTTTVYIYHLKEEFKEVDISTLYDKIIQVYEADEELGEYITYNALLYTTQFWGVDEMYTLVEQLIFLAGVASVAFLLAAYIQKRRAAYYNLRTIGMSKLQVNLMIVAESGCICLPTTVLAVLLTVVSGALISWGIAMINGYELFYEVSHILIVRALLIGLIMFVLSTTIAIIATARKRLHGNNQAISIGFMFKWHLNKLKEKHIYSSIFLRERRVFKVRTLFATLLCFFFTGLILLASTDLWENMYEYNRIANEMSDFSASKSNYVERKYSWYHDGKVVATHSGISAQKRLDYGYSQSFFEAIDSLRGLNHYTVLTTDNDHLFEWDNMDNDPYINAIRNEVTVERTYKDENGKNVEQKMTWGDILKDNDLEFGYRSEFHKDAKNVFEEYNRKWGTQTMNYDKFEAGEQVFVVMQDVGSFIKEGTTLYIVAGDESVPVEVAAVVSLSEVDNTSGVVLGHDNSDRIQHYLKVVGSEKLGKKVAGLEGTKYMYNDIEIYLNKSADYNMTIKQCASLLDSEDAKYWANHEARAAILSEFRGKIFMYALFMGLILAFFVIIRANMIQSGFRFQGNQIRRLRLLGMEKRKIERMYIFQGLFESKWLWILTPLVYIYRGYLLFDEYRYNAITDSRTYFYIDEIKKHICEPHDIVKYTLDRHVNIYILIAIVVLVILINVLTRYFVVKSYLKELDKENFC